MKENRTIPEGFYFAKLDASLDAEHMDWLALLESGCIPEHDVKEVPKAWMVQDEWLSLLKASLAHKENRSWNAYMQLGVMLYESGMEQEAIEAWNTSLQIRPSVWVYRNLAEAMKHFGRTDLALAYWKDAYNISSSFPDRALAEEYLNLLITSKQYEEAWHVYNELPEAYSSSDRIQIIVGVAALELDQDEFVKRLFHKEFAVIREGEILIIELWYKYNAKQLAQSRNETVTVTHLEEAKSKSPPPTNIDFRIIGE